jgi:hypothetical protein
MSISDHGAHLENLNRQLRIGDVINVLMSQSNILMDIVKSNQKEVNRLKEELEQLKVHTDNATDSIAS